MPLIAGADDFPESNAIVQRDTDIIKHKMELRHLLDELVLEKDNEVPRAKLKEFFETSTNEKRFKPLMYDITYDFNSTRWIIFLTVFYDSFKFETFNLIHTETSAIVIEDDDLRKKLTKK